jgi:hypothetical protein
LDPWTLDPWTLKKPLENPLGTPLSLQKKTVEMPRFSTEKEMEIEGFLDTIEVLSPTQTNQIAISTPKTQLIERPTSVKTVKPVLAKRAFDFEFGEVEESPLKLRKPTKKCPNVNKGFFTAGQNSPQKAIEIADVQQAISEGLKPLILEIQQLKIEILSLKKENSEFSSQITQNQTKILRNENRAKTPPSQPSQMAEMAEKAIQKTAKKTFAEIAKINSLVAEQSNKLDQWTLIQRKKSQSKEIEPKNGLEPVDRRILFNREKTSQFINIPDLLLAINKAIKEQGLPEHIRLLRLWETPLGAISGF